MAVKRIGGVADGLHAVGRGQRKPGLTKTPAGAAGEEKTRKGGGRDGRYANHPARNSKVVGEFAMAPMVSYQIWAHMRSR
jgi:hypothetical protein